jgi:hypothetical protein
MSHKSHKEIHKKLRKHAPESVKKAKKIFSFKYPKLFILIVVILLTYYIFTQPFISEAIGFFSGLGHFGVFLSGMLTSIGFSAVFGFGLLSKINPSNILIATLIAGVGATITDLIIFKSIKLSFVDEFKKLEKTTLVRDIEKIVKKNKFVLIRHYLLYIFAGIVLATPLPDELGVSMLAGLTTIKPLKLTAISFVLHSFTIFLVLSVI